MVFHKDMYEWLDEHKVFGNGNVASFDPYGRAFYFYLKLRAVRDEKNVQDIFIEQMFKKDGGQKTEEKKVNFTTPTFNSQKLTPIKDLPPLPTATLADAFGQSFEDDKKVDEPF